MIRDNLKVLAGKRPSVKLNDQAKNAESAQKVPWINSLNGPLDSLTDLKREIVRIQARFKDGHDNHVVVTIPDNVIGHPSQFRQDLVPKDHKRLIIDEINALEPQIRGALGQADQALGQVLAIVKPAGELTSPLIEDTKSLDELAAKCALVIKVITDKKHELKAAMEKLGVSIGAKETGNTRPLKR